VCEKKQRIFDEYKKKVEDKKDTTSHKHKKQKPPPNEWERTLKSNKQQNGWSNNGARLRKWFSNYSSLIIC